MKFMNSKLILFIAEVLAVAAMRVIYIMQREKNRYPRGSKVRNVRNRPVYRPTTERAQEPEKPPEPEDEKPTGYVYKPPPRE